MCLHRQCLAVWELIGLSYSTMVCLPLWKLLNQTLKSNIMLEGFIFRKDLACHDKILTDHKTTNLMNNYFLNDFYVCIKYCVLHET